MIATLICLKDTVSLLSICDRAPRTDRFWPDLYSPQNRSVSDGFADLGAKRLRVSRKSVPKRTTAVAAPAVPNPEPRLLGYARVSTAEQNTEQQRHALRAAGCAELFEDVLSGAAPDRDGLTTCLAALRPGDTLVVARLDRLGRSMPHLVSTVHELAARGVGFRSLAESIDTTSATGRLVLHLFAALADFERELISERTRASLAAKRRRGEPIGRPRALTPSQVAAAKRMVERGESPTHVARLFRCGRATLYRAIS